MQKTLSGPCGSAPWQPWFCPYRPARQRYEAFGEQLGTDVANSIVSPNHPGERRWDVVRHFHRRDIDIGFCDQTSGAHTGNRCYKAISPPRNVDEILDVRL